MVAAQGNRFLLRRYTASRANACSVVAAAVLAALVTSRPASAFGIVRVLAENAAGALAMTVGACMTKDVATCKQTDTIAEIMETMTSCRFGHMPVIDEGRVAGIVSSSDVVKTRIADLRGTMPPDFRISYTRDQSNFISESFKAVQENLIMGGLFSVYESIHRFQGTEGVRDPWLAIGILVFSIVLEAFSLWGALKIIRQRQGSRTFWQWFRTTRQSELMVIAGEDIAALAGLVFALIALLLTVATGNPLFDAAGTAAIGVLLIVVAMAIVREVKSLIIGESAEPEVHAAIERFIGQRTEVAQVLNLITLQWGDHIVVAAKVRMKEARDARLLIGDINACEAALRQQFPAVTWIFFEPDTTA
jgi:divalent metal cation (Fe/Co/Zn/Cd) transporter